MQLKDYMNPEKFPLTSHKGSSAETQLFMDSFNMGILQQAIENGRKLSENQKKIWAEFQIKGPWIKSLNQQIRAEHQAQAKTA